MVTPLSHKDGAATPSFGSVHPRLRLWGELTNPRTDVGLWLRRFTSVHQNANPLISSLIQVNRRVNRREPTGIRGKRTENGRTYDASYFGGLESQQNQRSLPLVHPARTPEYDVSTKLSTGMLPICHTFNPLKNNLENADENLCL